MYINHSHGIVKLFAFHACFLDYAFSSIKVSKIYFQITTLLLIKTYMLIFSTIQGFYSRNNHNVMKHWSNLSFSFDFFLQFDTIFCTTSLVFDHFFNWCFWSIHTFLLSLTKFRNLNALLLGVSLQSHWAFYFSRYPYKVFHFSDQRTHILCWSSSQYHPKSTQFGRFDQKTFSNLLFMFCKLFLIRSWHIISNKLISTIVILFLSGSLITRIMFIMTATTSQSVIKFSFTLNWPLRSTLQSKLMKCYHHLNIKALVQNKLL